MPKANSKATLLLVDDNKHLVVTLSDYLTYEGFNVISAKTGAEILERAAILKPDAIVMKDILPGMNGRVVAPLVRAMPSTQHIPIVLYDESLTFETESRYARRAPHGVSQFVTSNETDDLLDALSALAVGN